MLRCLNCNESSFEVKSLRSALQVKKQNVEVVVPSNVCKNCGASLMDNEQMNVFRKAVADRYRQTNGLLTSSEIIAFREKLGLSQIAFARFLNVGEASIKRWETYYIQDDSQDDHIRVKCDPLYSESNYFYLQSRSGDADMFRGFKPLSPHFVKQVGEFFEKAHPECSQYLRKLHFYTDFLHFKRHQRSITGLRYTPLKSGPSPCNFNQLTNFIQCGGVPPAKLVEFDDKEKQTLDDVCNLFLRDNGQMLNEYASKERGYVETNEDELISYGHARDLLI